VIILLLDADLYEVEKYKVYSEIINSEFNGGLIFILDTTASGYWIRNKNPSYIPDTIQSIFPSLKFETIEEYITLNQTSTRIEDKFNLSVDYSLISLQTIIDPSDSLALLSSIIDFTNVAFDQFYMQAFVYVGIIEPHGGFGRFLYLEKDSDIWIIKNVKYMWALK